MRKLTIIVALLMLTVCLFSNEYYDEGRLIFKTFSTIDTIYTNQDSLIQINQTWFDTLAIQCEIYNLYPIVDNAATSSLAKTYICEFPDSIACAIVQRELEDKTSYVKFAVYDLILYNHMEPDDEYYSSQWNLEIIGMEDVWDGNPFSADVNVAVFDSGIDCADPDTPTTLSVHEDLVGQILTDNQSNLVYYPDDQGDPYPYDEMGHGTWVSGIINALTDNEDGVASLCGIDDAVKILPMKHPEDESFLSSLLIACNWLYAGLDAEDFDVDVLNISMGTVYVNFLTQNYIELCEIIEDLIDDFDLIIVASAGNDYEDINAYPNYIYIPGDIEGVLTIGSSNNNDELAFDSNYGYDIFACAPGTGVKSTYPHHDNGGYPLDPYETFSGTSASAPHVSGMMALLKSNHPTYTNSQIFDIVDMSSDDMVLSPNEMGKTGSGRINVAKALEIDLLETNPNFVISHLDFEGVDELYNLGRAVELDVQFVNYGDDLTNVTITGEFSAPGLTFTIDQGTYWSADGNGVFSATGGDAYVSFGAATERNTVMNFVFTATDIYDEVVYCDTLYADVQLYYTGGEYQEEVTTELLVEDVDQDQLDEVIYGLKHITALDYEGRLVCLNNGTMSHVTISDAIYLKPVAADLNDDGDKEIVVVTKRGTSLNVYVYDCDLDYITSVALTGDDAFGLVVEDVENDGDLEIIVNTNLSNGQASYQIILDACTSPTLTQVNLASHEWVSGITAANVNEDYYKEVVGVLENGDDELVFGILYVTNQGDPPPCRFDFDLEGEIEPGNNHTCWTITDPVLAKNVDTGNFYHHLFINIWEFCVNNGWDRGNNKMYCFDLTDASSPVWVTELTCYALPIDIVSEIPELVIGDYTDDSGLEILVSSAQRVVDLEDGDEIQYFAPEPQWIFDPLTWVNEPAAITNVNQDSEIDMIGFHRGISTTTIYFIDEDQVLVEDETLTVWNNIKSGGIGWDGSSWKFYYIMDYGVLSSVDLDCDRDVGIEWSQKFGNARSTSSYYQPIPEEIDGYLSLHHDAIVDYDIEISSGVGNGIEMDNGTEIRFEVDTEISNNSYLSAESTDEDEPIILAGMCSATKTDYWDGINCSSGSHFYMTYCDLSNAENIYLNGSGTRKFHHSNIHHNRDGIYLYNYAEVILFDSYIEDNDSDGIKCFNNSTTTMGPYGAVALGYNNINDNDVGLELYSSTVVMGDGYNNFDQTNDSYNIRLASGAVSPAIDVEDTWWGTTNSTTIKDLFNISSSFDFDPFSTSINVPPTRSGGYSVFQDAVIAANSGNYNSAIDLYKLVLTDSIYSWEDFAALNGLFHSCYKNDSLNELSLWLEKYETITNIDFELDVARLNALILRENEQYEKAIALYESILNTEPDYEDSCYCIVDIGDTYFESAKMIRSGYLRNIPMNYDEYRVFRTQLLDSIGNGEKENSQIISPVKLHAVYPNPFNPETNIDFSLMAESAVKIDIYNVKGQHVKSLYDDVLGKGEHNVVWNGTNNKNKVVGSGVYFVRLRAGSENIIRKVACIK